MVFFSRPIREIIKRNRNARKAIGFLEILNTLNALRRLILRRGLTELAVGQLEQFGGLLKKAASGVLAIFPCSRTEGTLRAQKWLRPCWTNFFEPPRGL